MKITLYDDNYCCIEYDTQDNQCFYADLMLSSAILHIIPTL